MICKLYELGYGEDDVYEKIKQAVREAPQFRFDWYIRSRSALEISRRCAALVAVVEREMGDLVQQKLREREKELKASAVKKSPVASSSKSRSKRK